MLNRFVKMSSELCRREYYTSDGVMLGQGLGRLKITNFQATPRHVKKKRIPLASTATLHTRWCGRTWRKSAHLYKLLATHRHSSLTWKACVTLSDVELHASVWQRFAARTVTSHFTGNSAGGFRREWHCRDGVICRDVRAYWVACAFHEASSFSLDFLG